MGRRTPLVLVAIVFLVSCPRIPDPERTTVDGQDVFLIQDAPCGIGDCAEAFYINKVLYTPTHGKLPRWLRAEARRGPLFAVADPDALPPLPFVRATRLTQIEPSWIVGARFSTYQGSKWTIAWRSSRTDWRRRCATPTDLGWPRSSAWIAGDMDDPLSWVALLSRVLPRHSGFPAPARGAG